jgi:hypothetical protein
MIAKSYELIAAIRAASLVFLGHRDCYRPDEVAIERKQLRATQIGRLRRILD